MRDHISLFIRMHRWDYLHLITFSLSADIYQWRVNGSSNIWCECLWWCILLKYHLETCEGIVSRIRVSVCRRYVYKPDGSRRWIHKPIFTLTITRHYIINSQQPSFLQQKAPRLVSISKQPLFCVPGLWHRSRKPLLYVPGLWHISRKPLFCVTGLWHRSRKPLLYVPGLWHRSRKPLFCVTGLWHRSRKPFHFTTIALCDWFMSRHQEVLHPGCTLPKPRKNISHMLILHPGCTLPKPRKNISHMLILHPGCTLPKPQ